MSRLADDRDRTGHIHDQKDEVYKDDVDTATEYERCQKEDGSHDRVHSAENVEEVAEWR